MPRELAAHRQPSRVRARRVSAGSAERVRGAIEVVVASRRERTVRMFGSGLRKGKSSVDAEPLHLSI